MLGDIDIFDEHGNSVKAFDTSNLKEPFPAFHIVNENLQLRPGFSTDRNKDTWLDSSSQEYANLFGDAGKIPKAIAFINGDYRDSSSYYMDKNLIGATFGMFKRWFAATYNKKVGSLATIGQLGSTEEAGMIIAQRAALIGLNTGSMVGMIGAAAATSYIKYKSLRRHELELDNAFTTIAKMSKDIVKNIITGKFLLTGVRTLGAAGLKAAQMNGFQKLISNETISKLAGFNEADVAPENLEKLKQQLHFQLASLAHVLFLTSARILLMTLFAPDDDERKKHNKDLYDGVGFWERTSKRPLTTSYYVMQNLATSLVESSDALDLANAAGIVNVFQDHNMFNKIYKLLTSVDGQLKNGNMKSGDYKGDSRIYAAADRLFTPSVIKGGSPNFGFTTYSRKDFVADYLDQLFKSETQKAKEKKKADKAKYGTK